LQLEEPEHTGKEGRCEENDQLDAELAGNAVELMYAE
jgi:hypothetical protein